MWNGLFDGTNKDTSFRVLVGIMESLWWRPYLKTELEQKMPPWPAFQDRSFQPPAFFSPCQGWKIWWFGVCGCGCTSWVGYYFSTASKATNCNGWYQICQSHRFADTKIQGIFNGNLVFSLHFWYIELLKLLKLIVGKKLCDKSGSRAICLNTSFSFLLLAISLPCSRTVSVALHPEKANQVRIHFSHSKNGPKVSTAHRIQKKGVDFIEQSLPPNYLSNFFLTSFQKTKRQANQPNQRLQWIHPSTKQANRQPNNQATDPPGCPRPEKRLSVQLVRWAAQATALEARSGGRPLWLGWSWRTTTLGDWGSIFWPQHAPKVIFRQCWNWWLSRSLVARDWDQS